MAVFEGAVPETTEDWQRNQGCTRGWGTRSQVNTLKMGTVKCTHQISEAVVRSVITPDAPEDSDTCQWATGHNTLKNKHNPNLPPVPKPCQFWESKKKKERCFQVIILQDLYTKYLPLSMHACTGSTSFIRQRNPKSLAGLGTFVILAHADLQLQNVYLAVKSLWSNNLWWIQHIVFLFWDAVCLQLSWGAHLSFLCIINTRGHEGLWMWHR